MIDSYAFGHVTIDGTSYRSDVIIYPDRVDSSWWRKQGHNLCLDDIREVLASKPEVLVLGKGKPGLMDVPESVRKEIEAQGVTLYVAATQNAVKKYNEIHSQKKTVAALHLTC